MIKLTIQNLMQINKRLNENMNKGQNLVHKRILESILQEANSKEDPLDSAFIVFYRLVKEHPFYGANRRTAYVASDMLLQLHGKHLLHNPLHSKLKELFNDIRANEMPRDIALKHFHSLVENIKKEAIA